MTTTIIRGLSADGGVSSGGTSYSTVRSGSGFAVNTTDTVLRGATNSGVGQLGTGVAFQCGEAFIAFDIGGASIPSEDSIIDADLQIFQVSGTSVSFDVEARDYDWGPTLTTGDWVAGDDLGDLDLLATLASSTATNTTRTFTPSGSALIAHVEANRTGTSRMLLNSSRHRNGDQPSSTEYLIFGSADAGLSANRPTLVIEHEESGVSLTADDLTSQTELTSPTLTEHQTVTPDDLASLTELTEPDLTQAHFLQPDSLTVLTELTSPDLGETPHFELSADDLTVLTLVESPVLAQHHELAPADLTVLAQVTEPLVATIVFVDPDSLAVLAELGAPDLTQAHLLQPDDLTVMVRITDPFAPEGRRDRFIYIGGTVPKIRHHRRSP